MPWVQSAWVFVGAFLTLTLLSALSSAFTDSIGYVIVLGPFGALSEYPVVVTCNSLYDMAKRNGSDILILIAPQQ